VRDEVGLGGAGRGGVGWEAEECDEVRCGAEEVLRGAWKCYYGSTWKCSAWRTLRPCCISVSAAWLESTTSK
jgi:hypothetical protein